MRIFTSESTYSICGGIHYGEVEGLVSIKRWSYNRVASCVVNALWRV